MDRNSGLANILVVGAKSLSARRAWIEIETITSSRSSPELSLSARRAWIEIIRVMDRNNLDISRSPQGERG